MTPDKYVPGHFECRKCKFYLVSNTLHVNRGTISANNDPVQCDNGCGPMWRVSWQDHCKSLAQSAEKFCLENNRLHKQLDIAMAFIRGKLVCVGERHDCPSCNGTYAEETLSEIDDVNKEDQ